MDAVSTRPPRVCMPKMPPACSAPGSRRATGSGVVSPARFTAERFTSHSVIDVSLDATSRSVAAEEEEDAAAPLAAAGDTNLT